MPQDYAREQAGYSYPSAPAGPEQTSTLSPLASLVVELGDQVEEASMVLDTLRERLEHGGVLLPGGTPKNMAQEAPPFGFRLGQELHDRTKTVVRLTANVRDLLDRLAL